jgi:hypothetical protein
MHGARDLRHHLRRSEQGCDAHLGKLVSLADLQIHLRSLDHGDASGYLLDGVPELPGPWNPRHVLVLDTAGWTVDEASHGRGYALICRLTLLVDIDGQTGFDNGGLARTDCK